MILSSSPAELPAPRFDRWCLLALGLVLVVAAIPRLFVLQAGLPDYPHEDELYTVRFGLGVAAGRFNPHFFDWPGTLLFYIAGIFYRVVFTFAGVIREPGTLVLLARLPTLAFGLASVVVAFLATRRLSLPTAVMAGLVIGLSPEHVRQSGFGMTDVPTTFFLLTSLWLADRASSQASASGFFWAGVVGGLGCAIKYYCGIVGVGLAVAGWIAREPQESAAPLPSRQRVRFVLLAALGGIAGFCIGCPCIMFATGEVLAGLAKQLGHQATGHLGNEQPYWTHLPKTVSWPVIGAALVGVVPALRRSSSALPRAVLATAIAYLAVMSLSQVSFTRYTMVHVALLGILAGEGVAWVFGRRWICFPVILLLVSSLGLSTLRYVQGRRLPDTRDAAKQWVLQQNSGPKIIRLSSGPNLPAVAVIDYYGRLPRNLRPSLASGEIDYVILDSQGMSYFAGDVPSQHAALAAEHRQFHDQIKQRWRLVHEQRQAPGMQGPTIWVYAPPKKE